MITGHSSFRSSRKMAESMGRETAPGSDCPDSDSDLDGIIGERSLTIHPLGTCAMGSADRSVVDGELRVFGVDSLHVVDASVMPDIIGGNIDAAVIMIAEKAAEMLRTNEPGSIRRLARQPASQGGA